MVTFFITGSLSMALSLLHTLSPELLALRVQETVWSGAMARGMPQVTASRAGGCPHSCWRAVARVPSMRSRSWERAVMPSFGKLR